MTLDDEWISLEDLECVSQRTYAARDKVRDPKIVEAQFGPGKGSDLKFSIAYEVVRESAPQQPWGGVFPNLPQQF